MVHSWIKRQRWIEVSQDTNDSREQHFKDMCRFVKGAKKTLVISASNFFSIRSPSGSYEKFVDAIEAKLRLLKAGKFNSVIFICGRVLFAEEGGKEDARILKLLKEYFGTPGLRVYVGEESLFNHAVIADGVRGLVETAHNETGPKAYRLFDDARVAYLVRVASFDDQIDSGRIQPLLGLVGDDLAKGGSVDEWLGKVYSNFWESKEAWNKKNMDHVKHDDFAVMEDETEKRFLGLASHLGF